MKYIMEYIGNWIVGILIGFVVSIIPALIEGINPFSVDRILFVFKWITIPAIIMAFVAIPAYREEDEFWDKFDKFFFNNKTNHHESRTIMRNMRQALNKPYFHYYRHRAGLQNKSQN